CTPLSGATGRPARPQDPTIVPDGAGVTGRWVRRRSAAVGGDRGGPLGLLELADRGDLHPVELPDLGRGPRPPDGRERPTGDVEGAGERLRVPDGTPGVGRGDLHTVDEEPPGARPEPGRRRDALSPELDGLGARVAQLLEDGDERRGAHLGRRVVDDELDARAHDRQRTGEDALDAGLLLGRLLCSGAGARPGLELAELAAQLDPLLGELAVAYAELD